MRIGWAIAFWMSLSQTAMALAPESSPRPVLRGQADTPALSTFRPTARPLAPEAPALIAVDGFRDDGTTGADPRAVLSSQSLALYRPAQRSVPTRNDTAPELSSETVEIVRTIYSAQAVRQSLRPERRSAALVQKAMAKRRAIQRGAVCGVPEIQGEVVGYVPGKLRGCGVQNAVKLRSVSGVALSQRAIMDCGTAKALNRWVDRGMKPAVGSKAGGVREIHVVAHYACRTRNSQRGAKISEHGKGRAIDIAGFRMNDGSSVTVLKGWGQKGWGKVLREMHKTACGPFGTVLGPNSNKFHRDHFHFDTARYRSGSYCR